MRPIHYNGTPSVLALVDGTIISALSLDIHEGKIRSIFGHRNPDKLRGFSQALNPPPLQR